MQGYFPGWARLLVANQNSASECGCHIHPQLYVCSKGQIRWGLPEVEAFTMSVFHKGKFRTSGQIMCFWEAKCGRRIHSYCNYQARTASALFFQNLCVGKHVLRCSG